MTTKCLINKKKLLAMVPLSERTIDTLEKSGQFPKRFALTARSVVWDQDEVFGWMDAVEVFPQKKDTVNCANIRHIWIMAEPLAFAWRNRHANQA